MSLLFSSDNSESNSLNNLARLERLCVRISTLFPRSEFYDLPWPSLRISQKVQSHPRASEIFILNLARFFFALSQTSQLESSGQRVNTLWFLLVGNRWYLSCSWFHLQEDLTRIGDNRGKFLIKRMFFDNFMLRATPSCRSWERSRSSNPSVNVCDRSNMVSTTSLFSIKGFPQLSKIPMDGTDCFLINNCNKRDEVFDITFDYFSYLLIFWECLLSAADKTKQVHCEIFPSIPSDSTYGASFTKCVQ